MQGERGASMGSLNFENGSSSSTTNPVVDQQIRWGNLQSLGDNDVQNYMNSAAAASADTNTNSVVYPEQRRFSLGEASSSVIKNEAPTITEHWMAIRHLEELRNNDKVELNHPLFMQQPSTANLNAAHNEGMNQVTGHPSLFRVGSGLIPENNGVGVIDGQRKRKAVDAGIGQSSSNGGFHEFLRGESSSLVSASPSFNGPANNDLNMSLNHGPRGFVPGAVPNLSAPPESSSRNFSGRVNYITAQPENGTVIRQPVAPSLSAQQLMDLRFRHAFENYTPRNPNASPAASIPPLSRNMIPSFQLGGSSSSAAPVETRQRSNMPLFVPPPPAGMINVNGPAGPSSSRTSVQPSPSLASYSAAHNHSQRRLSEHLIRRRSSLLSSLASNQRAARSSAPPPASQPVLHQSGVDNRAYSRAAVPRQDQPPNGVLPQSLQGRRARLAELRNVFEQMRRSGTLRLEDVMLLNQSMLGGAADRYRDMRLDVDNMSYEELLSLGERIGDVCTGLNEETISNRLKQRKYTTRCPQEEMEPCCCICQEEYNEGEEVGMLECGHGFHSQCIKEWLKRKNLCPICKTTGLNTAEKPGI